MKAESRVSVVNFNILVALARRKKMAKTRKKEQKDTGGVRLPHRVEGRKSGGVGCCGIWGREKGGGGGKK